MYGFPTLTVNDTVIIIGGHTFKDELNEDLRHDISLQILHHFSNDECLEGRILKTSRAFVRTAFKPSVDITVDHLLLHRTTSSRVHK